MSSTPIRLLIAAAALIATTFTAQAADMKIKKPVYKAPPPMPVSLYNDWGGFYIGGHLGYGWADTVSSGASGLPFDVAGASASTSPSGWLGGLQFGYNAMMQQYLLGLEIDLGYLGIKGSNTVGTAYANVNYGWYSVIAGRLGLAMDSALIYVKGGFAMARIGNDAGLVVAGVLDPTDFTSTSGTRTGYAIGGGLEYGLSPQWSMKGEYLYMDFGNVRSGNIDGDTYSHSNALHTFKLGLNYRFGGAGGIVSAKY
jgi:outer membrane immunogenic protein